MATNTKGTPVVTGAPATPAAPKPRKAPPSLVERVKTQLSTASLRGKINVDELTTLEAHIGKLRALLS